MIRQTKDDSKRHIKSTNILLRLIHLLTGTVLLVICAALVGLSYKAITSTQEQKSQLTQGNHFAIIELVYKENIETVFLPNDYGFLIQWLNDTEPNLYIYNKPEGSIRMTSDFTVFLAGLKEFPDGVKVDRIYGCGITALGMSEDNKQLLQQLINTKDFHMTDIKDNNYTVCSCEVLEAHYLTTANKQQ